MMRRFCFFSAKSMRRGIIFCRDISRTCPDLERAHRGTQPASPGSQLTTVHTVTSAHCCLLYCAADYCCTTTASWQLAPGSPITERFCTKRAASLVTQVSISQWTAGVPSRGQLRSHLIYCSSLAPHSPPPLFLVLSRGPSMPATFLSTHLPSTTDLTGQHANGFGDADAGLSLITRPSGAFSRISRYCTMLDIISAENKSYRR